MTGPVRRSDPDMAFEPRSIPLPGGRTVIVRPVAEDDVDGLAALYTTLGEEDLYRRFFQAHVPSVRTLQHMVRVHDRGGSGLVAVVEQAGVPSAVVAECSYELLPDGDGELGITVAPRWRGWLGPYLLDALLDLAAARGVANLQADVLFENRPMLALVRARGYVTADHYDHPAIVRVVVGAARRQPSWQPADDRARVLVESTGGRWYAEAQARAAGLHVLVCPGPLRDSSRCPAVLGEVCPLAAGADVIVDAVSLDDARGRALLDAHGRLHPAVPVCVELPPGARPRRPGSPDPDRDDAVVVVGLLQRTLDRRALRQAPSTPHAEPEVRCEGS